MRFVLLCLIFCLSTVAIWAQGEIEFITATIASSGTQNNAVLPAPTGVEVGDYMIVHLGRGNNSTPNSIPVGWSLITSVNGTNCSQQLYGKFVTTSEPANYTFGYGGGAQRTTGHLLVYRNVNRKSQIVNTANGTGTSDGNNNMLAPVVNVTTTNTMLLALFAARSSVNITDATVQGSMRERAQTLINGNPRFLSIVGDEPISGIGNTTTKSAGYAPIGSNEAYVATSLLLRPSKIFYAYQSGLWSEPNSWTRDPSGTTLIGPEVPTPFDSVVILNGRTITLSANVTTESLGITIQAGATLNLQNFTINTLSALTGGGLLRISGNAATAYFPTVSPASANTFNAAGGGTVEYFYSTNGTIDLPDLPFNNLRLLRDVANTATYRVVSNLSLAGNLVLTRTNGALVLQIGNSTVVRNLTTNGNVTVGVGCSITVVNQNAIHTWSIGGDLVNNGVVRFTNQATPNYTAATTTGAVNVTFTGNADNRIDCFGTTDFYRLIVDKGTDQTFVLTLNASATANFGLFAPNNQSNGGADPNPIIEKALWIRNGTLRVRNNVVMPNLSSGGNDFFIPLNGALWVDGGTVFSTDAGTGNRGLTVIGRLRVSAGELNTATSAGIVYRQDAQVIIEGGLVDIGQFRRSGAAASFRASYTQTGGTVIVRGAEDNAGFARFGLPDDDCAFTMSGGLLQISDPIGLNPGGAFGVTINPVNYNVTGGTIRIISNTGTPARINSTGPIFNLELQRTGSGANFELNANLTVLNNLSIQATGSNLVTNNNNVTVSGNFTIASGTTFTPGSSTLSFTGGQSQMFEVNGTIAGNLNNLTINKSADTLRLAGSLATFIVTGVYQHLSGVLNDAGKTLEARANLTLSSRQIGAGRLLLSTATSRTISGNGNGSINTLELAGPASNTTYTANAALIIRNALVFTANGANQRIIDMQSHNLRLDTQATVTGASGVRFIRINGQQSAGGVTKVYNTTSFEFPIGTGTNYTPALIALSNTPTAYGSITVRPVNFEHPNVTTNGRSLTYYWRVTQSDFVLGTATVSHTYNYVQSSVVSGGNVTEDGYVAARFDASTNGWVVGSTADVDESANTIGFTTAAFSNTIAGDYTAGDNVPTNPFGTVTVYFSYQSGPWNSLSTWSTAGHTGTQVQPVSIPNANSIVRIGDGTTVFHTVTTTANAAQSGSLIIANGSTLDLQQTTGHNFGAIVGELVSGRGRLRIDRNGATYQFPAGDFGDFLGANGGEVEYYNTTTSNVNLPTLAQYRQLTINAQNTGIITFPATNLVVLDTLRFISAASRQVYTFNTAAAGGSITVNKSMLVNGGIFEVRNNGNTRALIVKENVVVGSGGNFRIQSGGTNTIHELNLEGDLVNNGQLDLFNSTSQRIDLYMTGPGQAVITGSNGSASTELARLYVNKGADCSSGVQLNVLGTLTTQTVDWLYLQSGYFDFAKTSASITVHSAASNYEIPVGTCIRMSGAGSTMNVVSANSNAADLLIRGTMEVNAGTVNVGLAANNVNNDIEIASAGNPEILVNGGVLNINGQVRRSLTTLSGAIIYKQTGNSTVTIRGRQANNTRGRLEVINAGSYFEMTGSPTLIINSGGSTTFADLYVRPDSSFVNGGTVRLTPENAGGSETYGFDVTYSFYNLEILRNGGSGTATVNVNVNNLTVNNDLLLGLGATLNTNNLAVNIGGNFTKLSPATFSGGTSTVTFFGTAAALSGNFNNDTERFHRLNLSSNANVTLQSASPIRVFNLLEIAGGATLNENGNTIEIRGNVTNNGTIASTTNSATNTLLFNGSGLQNINGSGAFGNLVLNNSSNIQLNGNIRINRQLTLTSGLIDAGANKITFGPTAVVSGTFSATRMLRSNGVLSDAGITKEWSSTGSFTFPIGVLGKYTPATINITTLPAAGEINIRAVNTRHPSTRAAADLQLNYYWQVDTVGFNGAVVATHTYNYVQSDVTGNENNYVGGRFVLPNWVPLNGIAGAVNASNNTITYSSVNYLSGGMTAGESAEFTEVATYYSRTAVCTTGCDWESPSSWSTVGHGEAAASSIPNGAPVIIASGHTVQVTNNSQLAESVVLNGTAILNLNQSFAHNFGVVSGTGTIRIRATASEQFVFPGGNYAAFTSTAGGTVEFYNAGNGILPTQTVYNRIVFKDAATRTQANVDWIVNGDVILEAGSVVNTTFNRNWELRANWNNQVGYGGFVPGQGRVTFNRNAAQTLTGATQFYQLEASGGGSKTLQSEITVTNQLLLNGGRIYLGSNNLIMDSLAGVGGSPDSNAMVVQNGSGRMRKNYRSSSGSFTFPLGEEVNGADYSPVTLQFTAGTFTGAAQVSVVVSDAQSPECSGANNYLSRFWTFTHTGISAFTVNITARYTAADVNGTESSIVARMSRPALPCLNGSVANVGAKTISINGINVLNILTGGEPAIPEPTVSATLVVFSQVSATSMVISWTNGNGNGRLVLMRQGGAVNELPVDFTSYSADSVFASGSQLGTGNYAVFRASGNSVTVTGLTAETMYYVAVFEYSNSGIDIDFRTINPALGNRSTLATEPTLAASAVTFSSLGVSGFTVNWTNGDGANRLVLAKAGAPVDELPEDGQDYTANANFGTGDELGAGNFVVYAGNGNSFAVSQLDQNTRYHFAIFEYNGSDSLRNFLTNTPATGNQHTWLRLQLKAWLEGPYAIDDDVMLTNLTGIIPRQHPYSGAPWNFTSYDSIQQLPAGNLVDWVLVEVRMAASAAAATNNRIKGRVLAFIDQKGNLVDTAGNAGVVVPTDSNGQFYAAIYHRTHIPVMTAGMPTAPMDQLNGAFSYDFTDAVNKAFGTDALLELESGVWGLFAGRVENTTPFVIDQADRNATWGDRNNLGYVATDAALEGAVDATDRSLTWNNRNKASQIPQ